VLSGNWASVGSQVIRGAPGWRQLVLPVDQLSFAPPDALVADSVRTRERSDFDAAVDCCLAQCCHSFDVGPSEKLLFHYETSAQMSLFPAGLSKVQILTRSRIFSML
jgi:hypothetical protein